jgi:hypothetical protein
MNAYLFFIGFVATVAGVGFAWIILTALGILPDNDGGNR